MWVQWPMAGPPHWFDDLADHDACVEQLVRGEAISDATRIYWDVRLPDKIPTIEFRVMDVMTRLDETVAITGLIRGLVDRTLDDIRCGRPAVRVRPEILRVSLWQAARYGLSEHLLDPLSGQQVRAVAHVEALLSFVRDALERYGDYHVVSEGVRRMLDWGGGAARQRACHRNGGWEYLVRRLVEETAAGTPLAGSLSDAPFTVPAPSS
jgi:carboxylate-amine ligase